MDAAKNDEIAPLLDPANPSGVISGVIAMTIRRPTGILSVITTVIAVLLGSTYPSSAQLTIGLDRGTRNLLAGLPEAIRAQMLKLLQEALPLIDKSVEGYLTRVDEIIHKNVEDGLNAVQCTVDGTAAQLKDSTKASLVGIFFEQPSNALTPPGIAGPVGQLSTAISQTRDAIRANTSAKDIILAYADLLHHVAIVNCETKISPLPVATEVKAQNG